MVVRGIYMEAMAPSNRPPVFAFQAAELASQCSGISVATHPSGRARLRIPGDCFGDAPLGPPRAVGSPFLSAVLPVTCYCSQPFRPCRTSGVVHTPPIISSAVSEMAKKGGKSASKPAASKGMVPLPSLKRAKAKPSALLDCLDMSDMKKPRKRELRRRNTDETIREKVWDNFPRLTERELS